MMSDINSIEQRYQNDNTYRCVVDMMMSIIMKLELSPSEVREAAMYAVYRMEMLHGQPSIILRVDPTMPKDEMRVEQNGQILAVIDLRKGRPYR